MMHSVIRRSPSVVSSTVADPSTVTVRIQSASTSDLNVQDVDTGSSDDDDDADDFRQRHEPKNIGERIKTRPSSGNIRPNPSALGTNHNPSYQQHTGRKSADVTSSMRLPPTRPTTAISLPANPSASDNEWDLDSAQTFFSSSQRRNPSCPSISPTIVRSKPPTPSTFSHQTVPTVFTTTSECLGRDFRPQPRRDVQRRSQSVAKSGILNNNNPASPTTPIVSLTQDVLLGSIRALQNERQLCKYSVDYLIDATNMRPNELARKANVGARLPCHCGHTHSRCTLTVEFDQPYISSTTNVTSTNINHNNSNNSKIRELSRTYLGQLFFAVNHFISKAQQEGKRILIYGFELTPNSPLAVIAIQYLMLKEELSLTEATHRIHRLFPVIPLQHQQYPIMEKRFQDYLKQLDRRTFPRNFTVNNISGDGSSSGNENRHLSREFSWESSEMTTTTTITNSTPVISWTTIPMPIVNNSADSSQSLSTARPAWDR
ncbi:hypothetical protein I4U23_024806 [Adineta vaga]|nr:hypothetical protein I4U23_024806 [Adineta vaga]